MPAARPPIVVIAPDSFKGSLDAPAVCAAVARGLRRVWPGVAIRPAISLQSSSEEAMDVTRRRLLAGALATVSIGLAGSRALAQPAPLKISHQFPGRNDRQGRFPRSPVPQVRADVEKRTKVNSSRRLSELVAHKMNSQFSTIRKGALDLALLPLSYAGGEVQETNIGLMPELLPRRGLARLEDGEVGAPPSRRCWRKRGSSSSGGSGRRAASRAARSRSSLPTMRRASRCAAAAARWTWCSRTRARPVLSLPSNEI